MQNPDYVYDTGILNTTIAGDLAVIRLDRNANLTNQYIGVVSLVSEDQDVDNMDCTLAGWGRKGVC